MKRKPKLQIEGLPLKEVEEFNGVSKTTILKWRKPQKLENGVMFRPATGKHNLAKGAFLSTYFYSFGGDKDEPLYEKALNALDFIRGHIAKNCKNEDVLKDIEFLKEIFEKVKEIDYKV